MKIEQKKWTRENGWVAVKEQTFGSAPQLVLTFGGRALLSDEKYFQEIKAMYPESNVLMCSTAGEISDVEVSDDSIVLAAILFEKTKLRFSKTEVGNGDKGYEAGKKLAADLKDEGLTHVLVFSDGLKVNGTSLVSGLTEGLPNNVSVTGGLVGDGSEFKETLVGLDIPPTSGKIVAIGFYGDKLKVGYGSLGGWDTFGPERLITKSKDNVLYEVDNQSALDLYKKYLGDKAKDLPGSGLLFPLSLRLKDEEGKEFEVVRTLLAVDEKEKSMIFAGDMPEGTQAKLMRANFDRLIEGSVGAANMSVKFFNGVEPELAILVSCVGRKLVLKERIEEEVEAVRAVTGEKTAIIGFYSYGEICPAAAEEKHGRLHNQTMTITMLGEI